MHATTTSADVTRVLATAETIFGSRGIAARWMLSEPLAPFQQTAYTMLTMGRTDDVIEYLTSIESGFVG